MFHWKTIVGAIYELLHLLKVCSIVFLHNYSYFNSYEVKTNVSNCVKMHEKEQITSSDEHPKTNHIGRKFGYDGHFEVAKRRAEILHRHMRQNGDDSIFSFVVRIPLNIWKIIRWVSPIALDFLVSGVPPLSKRPLTEFWKSRTWKMASMRYFPLVY